jgi:hypothetical protein
MKRYKARFEHDCDDCLYLGQSGDHDLYVCPVCDTKHIGTIIARRSDRNSDYTSGTTPAIKYLAAREEGVLLTGKELAMAEALSRAKAEGFILVKGRDY